MPLMPRRSDDQGNNSSDAGDKGCLEIRLGASAEVDPVFRKGEIVVDVSNTTWSDFTAGSNSV